MNNLAILLLEAGTVGEAESVLRDALARKPEDVRLLFNLSYLYRQDFRLREAETAYRAARAIDPEAVDRFTRVTGNQGIFVIPARLGYGDLWRTRAHLDAGTRRLAENLASPLLGRLPLGWVMPAVLLALALSYGLSRLLGQRGRAGRCGHCGAKVCPTCLGNELRNGFCTPCHLIYVKAAPVDPSGRVDRPGTRPSPHGTRDRGHGARAAGLRGRLRPGLAVPLRGPPGPVDAGGGAAPRGARGDGGVFGGGARDLLGKVRPI
jgi:hypothetical protein